MNIFLIKEYIKKLKKEDIYNYAINQGIILEEYELSFLYEYIKNNYKTILYGNIRSILDEIKEKVKPQTYKKLENLYMQFKYYID